MHMQAVATTTKTGRLAKTTKDREDFVGIKIVRSGGYWQARFSVQKKMLAKIGNPKHVTVRGTPENGYLITSGPDITPNLAGGDFAYISVSPTKINLPPSERAYVWMKVTIEDGKRIRVPTLPREWVKGDPNFKPGSPHEEGEREMKLSKTAGDDPVRAAASTPRPLNGANGSNGASHGGNGSDGHGTSPVPKQRVEYELPAGADMAEAQALLAQKLDEARAIINALERRTGLRFTLSRNLMLVVDLNGRR